MNYIYLISDKKSDNLTLFKVGFTANLEKRIVDYSTYNPYATLLCVCYTQTKQKHSKETIAHKKLAKLGIEINEWVAVSDSDTIAMLNDKGLSALLPNQCLWINNTIADIMQGD